MTLQGRDVGDIPLYFCGMMQYAIDVGVSGNDDGRRGDER